MLPLLVLPAVDMCVHAHIRLQQETCTCRSCVVSQLPTHAGIANLRRCIIWVTVWMLWMQHQVDGTDWLLHSTVPISKSSLPNPKLTLWKISNKQAEMLRSRGTLIYFQVLLYAYFKFLIMLFPNGPMKSTQGYI